MIGPVGHGTRGTYPRGNGHCRRGAFYSAQKSCEGMTDLRSASDACGYSALKLSTGLAVAARMA
jgi:hypothetical protein